MTSIFDSIEIQIRSNLVYYDNKTIIVIMNKVCQNI